MGRLANVEKVEKARHLADRGRYREAMEEIRKLDVSKLKALSDFCAIAEIYDANGYTEEAEQILLKAYSKSKTRRILYQLARLAVKLRNASEAEKYYHEFLSVAPMDTDQYILRFLIDRLEQRNIQTQIASLEKLKESEYREEWAYELAKLYQKADMTQKCIQECHDIKLWFGEGEIVEKAAQLKESLTLKELEAEKQEMAEQPSDNDGQEEWKLEEFKLAQQIMAYEEGKEEEKEEETITFQLEEDTIEPKDELVQLAIDLLQADDYILTEEQLVWIQKQSDSLQEQYSMNSMRREQMEDWVAIVIDLAERRNMKRLLDIVEKSSYKDSGLLELSEQDFIEASHSYTSAENSSLERSHG